MVLFRRHPAEKMAADMIFFYIPDGETRTLAEIGDEDQEEKVRKYGDAIDQFAKWVKEKS